MTLKNILMSTLRVVSKHRLAELPNSAPFWQIGRPVLADNLKSAHQNIFKVISHLIYMVWLDLDVEPAPDTGTPSVEAHSSAVSKKH